MKYNYNALLRKGIFTYYQVTMHGLGAIYMWMTGSVKLVDCLFISGHTFSVNVSFQIRFVLMPTVIWCMLLLLQRVLGRFCVNV